MTVDEYSAIPWTVHGRAVQDHPGLEPYYLITIEELPTFSVVGPTRAAAEADFPGVLRDYIEAALEVGAPLPLPAVIASLGADA